MTKTLSIFALGLLLCFTAAYAEKSKKISEIRLDVEKNYLLIPMSSAKEYRKFSLLDSFGNTLGSYDGLLASGNGDWSGQIDVSKHKGTSIVFKYEDDGLGAPKIKQSDAADLPDYATDMARARYHFTPPYGWMNDPNGLVYYKGKWHMFYQHNPFSMHWKAPMHWGHAVSPDLFKWENRPVALYPKFDLKGNVDQPFSGTAYVDKDNRSGLFPPNGGVILAYTSTGRGECLLYTTDMVNFREVDFNPIIKAPGRDPRLFFNEDSGKWTIIRYEESADGEKQKRKCFAIYVSDDLKKWEKTDEIEGFYECPDMFKMDVVGASESSKWVVMEANGGYVVGDFDGRKFKRISKEPQRVFYGDVYAAQIWKNDPKGRILASAWIKIDPNLLKQIGQKYSQCLSLPWELSLVKMRDGQYQLRARVPDEIKAHFGKPVDTLNGFGMEFSSNIFDIPDARGNFCVYEGVADLSRASAMRLEVGSSGFRYIPETNMFHLTRLGTIKSSFKAQGDAVNSIMMFRMFVDSYSTEIQLNDGEAVVFLGDSFLNPEQPIKIGGIGKIEFKFLYKIPITRYTVAERGKMAEKRLAELLKPKEDKEQSATEKPQDSSNKK